jgi:sulfate permease, SulP family
MTASFALDSVDWRRPWRDWRADMAAGISSAMLTVPVAIGAGLVAFAPLGNAYANLAVQAGLLTAVIGAIVTAFFASSRFTVGGPSAATSLLLASGLAQYITARQAPSVGEVLATTGLLTLVSGLFILGMGALRLGNAVKFVPRPVVAGFSNGIALVVIYSQIAPALGLSGGWRLSFEALAQLRPGAAATALATIGGCWLAAKARWRVPPALGGIVTGALMHFCLRALFGEGVVGSLVGRLPDELPATLYVGEMLEVARGFGNFEDLVKLVLAGLLIATINAIQIMMAATAADSAANTRHDANRELFGFGLGNVVVSLLGGVPNTSSHGRASAHLQARATSRWAAVFSGLFVLLIVALATPLVAQLPLAVVAGLLIHMAAQTFDPWARDQFRRLFDRGERGQVLENVVVLQTMTAGMATLGLNPAIVVILGFVVTMLTFVRRISGSVIRSSYTCENRRSRTVRLPTDDQALASLGAGIRVFELEGALFFGTADRLREAVEETCRRERYVILDCRRVHDWDATGAQIVGQMSRTLAAHGSVLLLTYVRGRHDIDPQVRAYGLFKDVPEAQCFADDDTALEFAEDALLAENSPSGATAGTVPNVLLHDMDADERKSFDAYLERRPILAGEMIFRSGDPGDSLFIVAAGEVTLAASKSPDAASGGDCRR